MITLFEGIKHNRFNPRAKKIYLSITKRVKIVVLNQYILRTRGFSLKRVTQLYRKCVIRQSYPTLSVEISAVEL